MQAGKENGSGLRLSAIVFFLLFISLFYLMWLLIRPFLGPIVFGGILAGSFYPLFNKFQRKLKIKREFLAIFMCLLITLVIFVPLIYFVVQLSKETVHLYNNITESIGDQDVHNFFFGEGRLARGLNRISDFFNVEFNVDAIKNYMLEGFKDFTTLMLQAINGQLGNILSFFIDFLIMLLVIYIFFAEGRNLKRFIFNLSPLQSKFEELILQKFNQMNNVSLICNGLAGVIQGVMAGLGIWLTGISSPFLWTLLMTFLAFIPVLGISLIYIPACIYLWIKGKIWSSVLLFVYCTLMSFWAEHWFKPKFIGSRIQIHPLLIFFSIIGAISVFGMGGIFYGPLICTIFLTAVEIYQENYAEQLKG